MRQPLSIGFITTYSSLYPDHANNIIGGIFAGLGKDMYTQQDYKVIPEYVGQGSPDEVKRAVQKLLNFYNVDMIMGYVSYKAIPEIIQIVEKRQKLCFFFDMGEYLPSANYISPNIFYSSYQLWQGEYALGYWAHRNFGDKGAVMMPPYDGGYHLASSFRMGALAAGSLLMDFHVLPFDQSDPHQLKLNAFLQNIDENPPAYLHALFSGAQAPEFLAAFYNAGLHKKVPLLVSEPMCFDDVLASISGYPMSFYSYAQWSREMGGDVNRRFVNAFETMTGKRADVFALLGYEAGLALKEMEPALQQRDWKKIMRHLQTDKKNGPTGRC